MSTSTMSRSARIRSRMLSPLLAAGLLAATGSALAPAAASAAPSASPATASAPAPTLITSSLGLRATRIAAAQRGDPYRWGASGPSAFDCAGLVYYVYT